MSSLTRDDRLARQQLDTGDPGDTVYLTSNDHCNLSRETYHDDPDCHYLRGTDETTRESAQRRWLAPCLSCVVDAREVER